MMQINMAEMTFILFEKSCTLNERNDYPVYLFIGAFVISEATQARLAKPERLMGNVMSITYTT